MSFLRRTSIAIDISDRSIALVRLQKGAGKVKVTHHGRVGFPEGIVSAGRVVNPKALKKVLDHLFEVVKPSSIKPSELIVSLADQLVFTHVFELEPHDKGDRDDIVADEVRNTIPISEQDTQFEYVVLHEDKEGVRVLVTAVSKKELTAWRKILKLSGVKVSFFDTQMLSVHRGLFKGYPSDSTLLIDVGSVSTSMSVFDEFGLLYIHTIFSAGDAMTALIAESQSISMKDAELLKRNEGLSNPGSAVASVAVKHLEPIIRAAKESLDYAKGHGVEGEIDVVLVGGTARMKGVVKYFEANLQEPVVRGVADWTKPKLSLSYVGAAGAARKGLMKSRHPDPVFATERASFVSMKNMFKGLKKSKKSPVGDTETEQITVPAQSKTMMLLSVLMISVVLLGGVWLFQKKEKKSDQEKEAAQSVYVHESTIVVSALLATSDEKYGSDRISGRIVENKIQEAISYGNAVGQSREKAMDTLRDDEVLWPIPMYRVDEEYPINFRWFMYNQSEMDGRFKADIDSRNDGNVDYIIKTTLPVKWEFTEDIEVLRVEAQVTIAAQQPFVDKGVEKPVIKVESVDE